MRKYIILIVLTMCCFNIYAWDDLSEASLKGPVKKVTETIFQNDNPLDIAKTVAYFDSIGRVSQIESYGDEGLMYTDLYQYISDTCVHYSYNSKGEIDSHLTKTCMDSNGRNLVKFTYWNNILTRIDSFAYDKHGHIKEKYSSAYREKELKLELLYDYDSLGRITQESNLKQNKGYKITYHPNGNYTKYFFDVNGIVSTELCVVNDKGLLIKEKSEGKEISYQSYDKYGNWLIREGKINTYKEGWKGSTAERVIEYYE